MTTVWKREHVAQIAGDADAAPVIVPADVVRVVPGRDLWDPWPVRQRDGSIATVAGRELWIGLSVPAVGHPSDRHAHARLWLASHGREGWRDHGPVFPDDRPSLGSREWAGCAVLDGDHAITVYYTAAGVRGELRSSYRQRIVRVNGRIAIDGGSVASMGWGEHEEAIRADGTWYEPADEEDGEPGFIKAFRDPFFFRDPADGRQYLLFTGSLAHAATAFNGAVGIAVADDSGAWRLQPPLVGADGVNNELERPHVVVHGGCYYLFFSTQTRTFHPQVTGPTGLYGFVAASLGGPYQPLNGSGLVVCNPAEEPYQAYSWLVLDDLSVVSFVDVYALGGRSPEELEQRGTEAVRRHFGGTLAPPLRLWLDGANAGLAALGSAEDGSPARIAEAPGG